MRGRSSARSLLVMIALTGAACERDDRPSPIDDLGAGVPVERLPTSSDSFEETPCGFVKPAGVTVQCGRVAVAEDPAAAAGQRISLAVARFFSAARTIADDPVVYLEGGPGGDALETVSAGFDAFEHLLAHRDLVAFDQRGTGASRPSLDCPELDSVSATVGDPEDTSELDALSACRDRLTEAGIDLNRYRSAENAADVDAVRQAFGYASWNLYGISYGTRLGLTVLRDHPEGVRSAILDGVLPLEIDVFETTPANAQHAFELVFAACTAEPACAAAFPDSMGQLVTAVGDLEATPAIITLSDGSQAMVTGDTALRVLFLLLYDATAIPYVPALIDLLAAGDFSFLELVLSELGGDSLVSIGMYLSVVCAEDTPFSSADAVAAAASALLPMFQRFADSTIFDNCARWNVSPAAAVEDQPVVSDVPTLLMSGTYDPVTPAANGDLVASALLAAEHVVVPHQSHGASTSACGGTVVDAFLADPSASPARGCVASLAAPPFETGRMRGLERQGRFHLGPIEQAELTRIAARAARQAARRP